MMQRAFSSSPVTRHPSRPGRPLDRRNLLAAIHANAKQLGMSDEDRRAFQQKLTSIESCRDMPIQDLVVVDRELRKLLKVLPAHRRPGRDERRPAEPPTREQMDLVGNLASTLGLLLDQYRRLCLRIVKHSWPQTREEANKVIEALKAMQGRGWKATEAAR